jgi:hypothetical protein
VWGFDPNGLVLCEDSYSGTGPGFEGIETRTVDPDQIYQTL